MDGVSAVTTGCSKTLMPSLHDTFTSGRNAVTPLRLVLALAVLVEHGFRLARAPGTVFNWDVLGMSPAYAAVNGFFILSGALIFKSLLDRDGDLIAYSVSRLLRLMPLLIAFALTVFLIGPLISDLRFADYVREPGALLYSVQVILFLNVEGGTPGAVAANPIPGVLGTPLWTLRYELIAYIGMKSQYGEYKVAIVSPADAMNRTAAILDTATQRRPRMIVTTSPFREMSSSPSKGSDTQRPSAIRRGIW